MSKHKATYDIVQKVLLLHVLIAMATSRSGCTCEALGRQCGGRYAVLGLCPLAASQSLGPAGKFCSLGWPRPYHIPKGPPERGRSLCPRRKGQPWPSLGFNQSRAGESRLGSPARPSPYSHREHPMPAMAYQVRKAQGPGRQLSVLVCGLLWGVKFCETLDIFQVKILHERRCCP